MSDSFTAEFLRDLPFNGKAQQKLWRVTPKVRFGWEEPQSETEYVVSSAVDAPLVGPETYLFPANEEGEIVDWGELPGSYRGGYDHDEAIQHLAHAEVF